MKYLHLLILAHLVLFSSCKQFLEIDPPSTKIDMTTAFASDAAAIALMTGVYVRIAQPYSSYFMSMTLNTGLSADELKSHGADSGTDSFYKNDLKATSFSLYWAELYNYIYTTNQVIEGLHGPNSVSGPVKSRLEGEAKFMRAYLYFNLVNLFGDVPIVTSTDYKSNRLLPRAPIAQVYSQMIEDLKQAQELLGTDYTTADLKTADYRRLRPNKWAATALLARCYLFSGNYNGAVAASSMVINEQAMYQLEPLERVFLENSKEAIFSLQPVSSIINTYAGSTFILVGPPGWRTPASLSDFTYNAFEAGDKRKNSWVGRFTDSQNISYNFAYKYKVRGGYTEIPVSENEVVFRLAEQYLIRAEAYIKANRIDLGVADLNALRDRARDAVSTTIPDPLPALMTSIGEQEALRAVEHERQVEMFTEWGDRWFTLKRMRGMTNPSISRADEVMPAVALIKQSTWKTYMQLYPIPFEELKKSPGMPQNAGYN